MTSNVNDIKFGIPKWSMNTELGQLCAYAQLPTQTLVLTLKQDPPEQSQSYHYISFSIVANFLKTSVIVQSLKGIKKKNSANLEQSVKICIQGQFFVLNKTRWGTRLIFECTPLKNTFFYQKNTLKLR